MTRNAARGAGGVSTSLSLGRILTSAGTPTSETLEEVVRRRTALAAALVAVVLLLMALPEDAWADGRHRHHFVRSRIVIGVGPVWWGAYPWYYPPPYYVYGPPAVVVQEPPVYIQR